MHTATPTDPIDAPRPPALRAAAGAYGATLPTAIVALAHDAAGLADALLDAAVALDAAAQRLGHRLADIAGRSAELARLAAAQPDAVEAGHTLARLARDLDAALGVAAGAVHALRRPVGDAATVETAAAAVDGARRAADVADRIAGAGRDLVAALRRA